MFMQVDSPPAILWLKNGPLRPQKKKKKHPSLYLDDCSENYNCSFWKNNKLRKETQDKFYNLAPVYHVCLMRESMFAWQLHNDMDNVTKALV